MQISCSDTFIFCYTRSGCIKAKLKTTEKWVTSPDGLFKQELMLIMNRWAVAKCLTSTVTLQQRYYLL